MRISDYACNLLSYFHPIYLHRFSELALLLPYHDIKLVLFGSPVARIVKEAKKTPGSLATKSPTFTYTAHLNAALVQCPFIFILIQLFGQQQTMSAPTRLLRATLA